MIERVATLPQAQAALQKHPTDDLELWSPENAAETQGVMWFAMLQRALRAACPDREPNLVLDCGARGDLAIEAIRLGLRNIALRAPAEVTAKVADIAARNGGRVITDRF
ncbi:hypothetical protein [Dongia sp.]|uniref:hypothetical protein n=1 Tax=Dongia sp. TaxID=1977262 RepID=UPI0035B174B4